jgi:hypothetical protein
LIFSGVRFAFSSVIDWFSYVLDWDLLRGPDTVDPVETGDTVTVTMGFQMELKQKWCGRAACPGFGQEFRSKPGFPKGPLKSKNLEKCIFHLLLKKNLEYIILSMNLFGCLACCVF